MIGEVRLKLANAALVALPAGFRGIHNVSPTLEILVFDEWAQPGTHAHVSCALRNRGGIGQQKDDMEAELIEYFEVDVLEDPGVTAKIELDRRHGRATKAPSGQFNLPSGKVVGLRDANLREPAAFVAGNGKLTVRMLDDRAPTYGYPFYAGFWRQDTAPTGNPDEIPGSESNHCLPGGHMTMPWHVLVTDPGAVLAIDYDPPEPHADAYKLVDALDSSWDSKLAPRVQAMMSSFANVVHDGVDFMSPPNQESFISMLLDGEARWATWNRDPSGRLFEGLPEDAQHLGWQSWPDLFWHDGHSNLHYEWVCHTYWMWKKTGSAWAWWITQRFAEYAMTAALCWTDDPSRPEVDKDREGRPHYEKSIRGRFRVYNGSYTGYPQAAYKFYARQHYLAARCLPRSPYASDIQRVMEKAILGYNYDASNGDWGTRTIGWGMMNAVNGWRDSGSETLRLEAIKVARNAVFGIMNDPARVAEERDPKWVDPVVGIPYVHNRAANPRGSTNVFGNLKMAEGLIMTRIYCDPSDEEKVWLDKKIEQMCHFFHDEMVMESGGYVMPFHTLNPDRVKAVYNNGTVKIGVMDPAFFTLPWLTVIIGYGAIKWGGKFKVLFGKLHAQYAEFADWGPPITIEYVPDGLVVSAPDLTTIRVNTPNDDFIDGDHGLRIAAIDPDDGSEYHVQKTLATKAGTTGYFFGVDQEIKDAVDAGHEVRYYVCGRLLSGVKHPTKDRAIKRQFVPNHHRPDPNRPFNYSSGLRFSTQSKMYGQVFRFADLDAVIADVIGV